MAHSSTTPSIHTLPPDLILLVYRFLDPVSHLEFALTTRRIFGYSSEILARHRSCYKLNRVCSDLATFPSLLRSITKDHIAACHVRTIAVWKNSLFLDDSSEATIQRETPDLSHELRSFFEAEMTAMAPLLADKIYSMGIPSCLFEKTDDGLIPKDLEACVTLLFAMCTRLQSIKFVRFQPNEKTLGTQQIQSSDASTAHYPQNHLCDAIARIFIMAVPAWPPGFLSLRTVALNCKVDDDEIHWQMPIRAADVASLLLLPNIETLYIRGLILLPPPEYDGNDKFACARNMLPVNSSSVKHLYFEQASRNAMIYGEIDKFIIAAKNLESIIFRGCHSEVLETTVRCLARYQADSLHTLFCCGSYYEHPWWQRYCSLHLLRPEEFHSLKQIRTITLNPTDLVAWFEGQLRVPDDDHELYASTYDMFVEYFQHAIPEKVETLIIHGWDFKNMKDEYIRAFDEAVVCLITEGRHPQLREVYVERHMGEERFDNFMSSGKNRRISVYTAPGSTRRHLAKLCDSIVEV